jgi:glycosyltransferase involved in cell wall biosynthesis
VIPHGFRYDRFEAESPKDRRILVVARIIPRKGVQYLLEALRTLDLRGFKVDVVGDGPYLSTLKEIASEHRLPVKFWGWLDNHSTELRQLYERSSIFVLPSEAESFGMVLLEAMASGHAIVTCSGTGAAEAIGRDALLVPPRRPDVLRAAVERLIGDRELRMSLAHRARARVEREFGWRSIAKRYVDIYSGIPEQAARRRPLQLRPSISPRLR